MTTGSLRSADYTGYYWGVSAYPSELYAYNLNFNSVIVFPSYNVDRWYGFTVQPDTKSPAYNPADQELQNPPARKAIPAIVIMRRIDKASPEVKIICSYCG